MPGSSRTSIDSPRRVVMDAGLHPQCLEVAAARCRALGIDVLRAGPDDVVRGKAGDGPLLGAVLAHTTSRGAVQDLAAAVAAVAGCCAVAENAAARGLAAIPEIVIPNVVSHGGSLSVVRGDARAPPLTGGCLFEFSQWLNSGAPAKNLLMPPTNCAPRPPSASFGGRLPPICRAANGLRLQQNAANGLDA